MTIVEAIARVYLVEWFDWWEEEELGSVLWNDLENDRYTEWEDVVERGLDAYPTLLTDRARKAVWKCLDGWFPEHIMDVLADVNAGVMDDWERMYGRIQPIPLQERSDEE